MVGREHYWWGDCVGLGSHVPVGIPEVFSRAGDESPEGEELEVSEERVSGVAEEVLEVHIWARGYFTSTLGID